MAKVNQNYETIFVIDVQNGEAATKTLVEKFTGLIADNGTITSVNEWGKRRLAYPINDLNEGYYVLVNFTAPQSFVAELERIYNITEGVMRSIIVKIDAKESAPKEKATVSVAEEPAEVVADEEVVSNEAEATVEAQAETEVAAEAEVKAEE